MFKLMIADDENLERQSLKFMIKDLSYVTCVAEARNGREAIEFNKEFDPDIIIMDIKMPGIDGIKATEIIKAENPNKSIIILTAHDDFELIHKALILGVNDYILKPVMINDLKKALKKVIDNHMEKKDMVFKEEESINENKETIENNNSPIHIAVNYINNNLNEDISLDKMASICNLSSCYFSKLFKKHMKVNFVTYVSSVKIKKAKELLIKDETPVLNIALDLGFEDCGYFIRVFKKMEGTTPKKYRETKRNK